MDKCLSCFGPLGSSDRGGWHGACSRRVFGTSEPPVLDLDLDDLPALGTALLREAGTVAGVQKKLSAERTGSAPGRLTLRGLGGLYLLKPPVQEYPQLPENEALCMELARQVGISTAPHGLVPCGGTLVYVTRRFDRSSKGVKIPQEDFCQLLNRPSADKYKGSLEAAAQVLRWSSQGGLDRVRFLELNIFAWLTGNADMHLKNFSLYRPEDRWEMTPAYDLVSTALVLPEDLEETALTVDGRKAGIDRRSWSALARRLEVPQKVLDGLLSRFASLTPTAEALVGRSFLSGEMKEAFLRVWNQRVGI